MSGVVVYLARLFQMALSRKNPLLDMLSFSLSLLAGCGLSQETGRVFGARLRRREGWKVFLARRRKSTGCLGLSVSVNTQPLSFHPNGLRSITSNGYLHILIHQPCRNPFKTVISQ